MSRPEAADPVTPGSDPAPRTRRRAPHILDNYCIGPARDRDVLEIWGYSDRFSYAPGETVAVRVRTTAERYYGDDEIAILHERRIVAERWSDRYLPE